MAAESRNPRHGPLDQILGERIRRRRRELSLSQSALGARLGITFQQIQKYENGTNRVSATMLVKLAEALEMTVPDLLKGAEDVSNGDLAASQRVALLDAFDRITDPDVRAAILTLVVVSAPK